MTVVFDAEPLLAFAFGETGAEAVERWLDRVYDGDVDGVVPTINFAEFRYVAIRKTSVKTADAHIDDLRDIGLSEYDIDPLWEAASELKAEFSLSLGDAYAVAAAITLDQVDGRSVTLLVGADDDFDSLDAIEGVAHLIERFRDVPA